MSTPSIGRTSASNFHPIKGYANASNPLTVGEAALEDPYVAEQQRMQSLLRNPSLRVESDGSMVYDPNYYPKHKKIVYMAPYSKDEDYDPVEPLFWLVCACVVGLAAFVAFVVVSALRLPFSFMRGDPIYIAAGSCGGFLFIIFFLFYLATSEEERVWGRCVDGFIGGLPFILLGALVGYMYSGFILMMVYLVNDPSISVIWWYNIFSAVPPFLLLFIPMFTVSMQVQEASAISARIFKGIPPPPSGYIPRTNHIPTYLFSAVRRFLVGFAMGAGMAAYYAITCYALGWLAYGLYKSTALYFWIPIVVMAPFLVVALVALCVLRRAAPEVLKGLCAPWTGPLAGWSRVPLRSAYVPRYHAGQTVKQMVRETNRLTREANRRHVRGEAAAAEELYAASDAKRAEIENRGVELRERDCRSWRSVLSQTHSGVTRKMRRKK